MLTNLFLLNKVSTKRSMIIISNTPNYFLELFIKSLCISLVTRKQTIEQPNSRAELLVCSSASIIQNFGRTVKLQTMFSDRTGRFESC